MLFRAKEIFEARNIIEDYLDSATRNRSHTINISLPEYLSEQLINSAFNNYYYISYKYMWVLTRPVEVTSKEDESVILKLFFVAEEIEEED